MILTIINLILLIILAIFIYLNRGKKQTIVIILFVVAIILNIIGIIL